MHAQDVVRALEKLSSLEKAKTSAWFFKTGKGEYGHGDVFYGITVPEQRTVAKKFCNLPLSEIEILLKNNVHECRLTALIILVEAYKKANGGDRSGIARFYSAHTAYINNWDLVDISAPYILGTHLRSRNRAILYSFARSKNVWKRRIAIVATFAFIRANQFTDTLAIAEILMNDTHDLIHKAVGWMLREVGKRSIETERGFLEEYAPHLPRTTLRYAIERFPEAERQYFLKKK